MDLRHEALLGAYLLALQDSLSKVYSAIDEAWAMGEERHDRMLLERKGKVWYGASDWLDGYNAGMTAASRAAKQGLIELGDSFSPGWHEFEAFWTKTAAVSEFLTSIKFECRDYVPERTCRNVGGDEWGFKCSECGGHTHGSPFHIPDAEREELAERLSEALGMKGGVIPSAHSSTPRFCPNCGARVVA